MIVHHQQKSSSNLGSKLIANQSNLLSSLAITLPLILGSASAQDLPISKGPDGTQTTNDPLAETPSAQEQLDQNLAPILSSVNRAPSKANNLQLDETGSSEGTLRKIWIEALNNWSDLLPIIVTAIGVGLGWALRGLNWRRREFNDICAAEICVREEHGLAVRSVFKNTLSEVFREDPTAVQIVRKTEGIVSKNTISGPLFGLPFLGFEVARGDSKTIWDMVTSHISNLFPSYWLSASLQKPGKDIPEFHLITGISYEKFDGTKPRLYCIWPEQVCDLLLNVKDWLSVAGRPTTRSGPTSSPEHYKLRVFSLLKLAALVALERPDLIPEDHPERDEIMNRAKRSRKYFLLPREKGLALLEKLLNGSSTTEEKRSLLSLSGEEEALVLRCLGQSNENGDRDFFTVTNIPKAALEEFISNQ